MALSFPVADRNVLSAGLYLSHLHLPVMHCPRPLPPPQYTLDNRLCTVCKPPSLMCDNVL